MKDIIEPQIEILKTGNISKVSRLMLESYPNLPQYDEVSGCINFSKEIEIPEEFKQKTKKVTRLQDVQKNGFIDSNYRDSRGNNIANVLTTHDDEEEALSILISAQKKGTDLNNRNKKYETPIGNALYNKMPHIVANLLPITDMPFVRVSGGIDSMLLFSNLENDTLSTNYMNIAKSRGLSVNSSDETGNTPLINAVNNGNITAMRFLLSSGANPNIADNFGQTALHHACINNNIEAINLLLDFYAYPLITDLDGLIPEDYLDIDVKNSLSSRFQEIYNIYELSDMNIKYNGSLEKTNCDNSYRLYNIDKLSSQILSGQNVDYEILNLTKNILQNQDIMQFKDKNQNTILHLIAQSNSKYANEALKTVIDKGINLDAKNSLGETALISALNEFICTTNIEHKINLLRNIKTLLDSDINVDSVDYNKQSALHKICQSGNIILFNEILKKNPKITQFDSNNKSAFEYIPLNKKNEMIYILKKYLENSNILKEKNNND